MAPMARITSPYQLFQLLTMLVAEQPQSLFQALKLQNPPVVSISKYPDRKFMVRKSLYYHSCTPHIFQPKHFHQALA